ncbi:MAG: undecaprenyldiphospho-muramoylpentapeptide beta-N-acetylglucosaminyltransferase [Candidatus Zixiibacteriota bacterium]
MNSPRVARLVFAGGGTGGHLYPAVAIADRVKELLQSRMKVEIVFIGTKRGIEYRVRDTLGYPLHIITVWGLARSLTLKNLLVPFVFLMALWRSSAFLAKFKPHLVVATGGYVCLPIGRMAASRNIPLVLQEQNSFPGISTRQLAPHAQRIFLGFEEGAEYLKTEARVLITGNPVRRNIAGGDRAQAQRAFNLDANKKTILVLGGSQGALAINQAVLNSLGRLSGNSDIQLLWQTGKRGYTDVIASAGEKVHGHSLFPFENRMELVYAAADIAIARAGAITMAELEACAVPAVLVPYPHAAGDHQRKNAAAFSANGYAVVVEENELPGIDLVDSANDLLANGEAARMRERMRQNNQGRTPAVDMIAEEIIQLISGPETKGEEA